VHLGPFQELAAVGARDEIVGAGELVLAPSCSPGRGGRVVVEIDSLMPGSCASSALTRVDLPAPEGAATMNRLPEKALVIMVVPFATFAILAVHK
jgi:hypothetical protein